MRISKKIIILNIMITTLILTSCNGSREVNELGIVISTAIDIEDAQLLLTHEVIVPQSNLSTKSDSKDSSIIYVQSKGDTILEAIRNATLIFDRRLFLAHNRMFILGEEFAKEGISEFMNFYMFDNEPRESAFMIVAKDAKAYEVMGINGGLGDTPGKYLYDLISNYNVNLKTRDFTMIEFIRYFFKDTNPVTVVVEGIEQKGIDMQEEDLSKEALDIAGGAVFYRDKLIGYYNGFEMMGFNFIVDEFENGLIVFDSPDELTDKSIYRGGRGKYTVAEIKSSKTKTSVELVDDELQILIDVSLNAVLVEDTKGLNVSNIDILKGAEKACSNQVREYIQMTMDKAQKEFEVDSFSVGNLVHIKYPDLWREISHDWDSIFPELSYTITVNTDFTRTGLLNVPVNLRREIE